ncbi:PaaI family thioesterase [Chelativorans sp. YIM 93263]|uniref:PaaI family thioesterase n=1 Tax=Chelativorans sp. YIM 93263 TaxID=2906648 RepID=UPI0023784EC2|nr:PaaI family thioesterase [Chelativorans sp. YIM 93263]
MAENKPEEQRKENSASAVFANARNRFPDLVGVKTERAVKGKARCTLEQRDGNSNAFESIHGGAVASLIDVAATAAARSMAVDIARVATLSLTITYMLPARGPVAAEAVVLSSGKRIANTRVDVSTSDGTLVATALANIRLQCTKPEDPPAPRVRCD